MATDQQRRNHLNDYGVAVEEPQDNYGCPHRNIVSYIFHCDGIEYRAFECRGCPWSTSMPVRGGWIVFDETCNHDVRRRRH